MSGRFEIQIDAVSYYLPEHVETSIDLQRDNSDWQLDAIVNKTGITRRFVSGPNETAADLVVKASASLFERGLDRSTIDAVIFVTQSPDYTLPTTACLIQERLSLPTECLAFDVNQGCAGFVYGLAIGASLINSSVASKVLLLCGDTYTKYVGRNDRTCRPIFSDGGSAAILSRSDRAECGPFLFGTDGSGAPSLIVRNSGSRVADNGLKSNLFMSGPDVFMFTIREVPDQICRLVDIAGMTLQDVDSFFFHQASKVVLENIQRKLNIPQSKIYTNLERVGNTVSSSIPIALCDAQREGRIKKGDQLLLSGFGVGLSWGSCLLKWGESY
jgi:3-oxoacyl-[acyl-carrier-protein] synthase-3